MLFRVVALYFPVGGKDIGTISAVSSKFAAVSVASRILSAGFAAALKAPWVS